jgi:hypothetical protein
MPVPKQLPQITILWSRHPDDRKVFLELQPQQESGVLAVGFIFSDSLGLNHRRVSNPQLQTQLCE